MNSIIDLLFLLCICHSPQHAVMPCFSLCFYVNLFLLLYHLLLMSIFLFRSSFKGVDVDITAFIAILILITQLGTKVTWPLEVAWLLPCFPPCRNIPVWDLPWMSKWLLIVSCSYYVFFVWISFYIQVFVCLFWMSWLLALTIFATLHLLIRLLVGALLWQIWALPLLFQLWFLLFANFFRLFDIYL